MSNKSGIADNIINLPEGGGAQKGMGETFSPDLFSGTGNFSFPITTPHGRNGLQPSLTVGYSSGNGNSEFGLGWGLSVPGVMRKTNRGIPVYDDEKDTFILSGAEDLIAVDYSKELVDGTWHFKTQYRPRTEGLFARIIHHKSNQGINYWEVRSKDGLISYYGNPGATNEQNTIIAHPERRDHIFGWKLYKTVDVFGNDIVYTYQRELTETDYHHYDQLYLSQIDYTNYDDNGTTRYLCSVQFEYEDREDAFSTHQAGFEIRTTQRIKHVKTYTHPKDEDRPSGYTSSGNSHIDILVKRYDFYFVDERVASGDLDAEFLPKNGTSVLSKVQVCGFDHQSEPEKMPPLEFRYSGFKPVGKDFKPITGENLPPVSLGHPEYEVADLNGNGLPDIVQINGQTARYWLNKGDGSFDWPKDMKEAPAGVSLAEAGVMLADADGDGRVDLLVNQPGVNGYFTLNPNGEWDHSSLKRYNTVPSFAFNDPEVQLMDMSGDGITDVLRNGERFEIYYHDRDEGWHDFKFVNKQQLDDFPNISFSDPRVRTGSFSGGGLQDIALLQNGNVTYWPNQGYGNWGKRVVMKNAPRLPHGFNPARIMLADFDGDGLIDIAYIDDNKVTLWVNQSGNAWSDPIEISGTPRVSDMDAVRAIDMMGHGVPGILWSYDAGTGTRERMYYLDLTGGVKPYLLNEMVNNMGALTRVQYRSSVKDYLRDENGITDITSFEKGSSHSLVREGRDGSTPATPELANKWKTTLPMPVLVVGKTEVHDLIAHSKLATEYSYHHGYWDGVEREFRGFGRVDQKDTETFDQFNFQSLFQGDNNGWHSSEIPETKRLLSKSDNGITRTDKLEHNQVEKVHYTPPMMTRTWFHQGPVEATAILETAGGGTCSETDWTELDHSEEYFLEKWDGTTPQSLTIERPTDMVSLLKNLPRQARRDAYRTLRGAVLRTELYALDGTRFQHRPYTVTEANYGVRQEFQPNDFESSVTPSLVREGRDGSTNGNGSKHSGYIFFSYSVGQRTTQWERGHDPMTSFAFTDKYDAYGIPTEQCAIAIPRYRNFLLRDGNPPKGYSATTSCTQLIHKDTETHYLIGRTAQSLSYEVINDGTATVFELRDAIFGGTAELNLLGHSQNFYDGGVGQEFVGLPFGRIGDYGVPVRSRTLLATKAELLDAYGEIPALFKHDELSSGYPDEFKQLTPKGLGYHLDADHIPYLNELTPAHDPITKRTILVDEGGNDRSVRGSRCYTFDGTNAYVFFDTNYPKFDSIDAAAISIWFKTSSSAEQHFMAGDSSCFVDTLGIDGGNIIIKSANSSLATGTTTLADNEWHFLAVNLDETNKFTHVYVDGVLEITQEWGTTTPTNISLKHFGAGDSAANKFNGSLKDFRLYAQLLDDEDRTDVQHFQLLATEKTHLPCEEEDGSVCINRGGHNGAITNATLPSFHATTNDLGYSFADSHGFSLADGSTHYADAGATTLLTANVVIPHSAERFKCKAYDSSGDLTGLDYTGRAAFHSHVTDNPCLQFGQDNYLEQPDGSPTAIDQKDFYFETYYYLPSSGVTQHWFFHNEDSNNVCTLEWYNGNHIRLCVEDKTVPTTYTMAGTNDLSNDHSDEWIRLGLFADRSGNLDILVNGEVYESIDISSVSGVDLITPDRFLKNFSTTAYKAAYVKLAVFDTDTYTSSQVDDIDWVTYGTHNIPLLDSQVVFNTIDNEPLVIQGGSLSSMLGQTQDHFSYAAESGVNVNPVLEELSLEGKTLVANGARIEIQESGTVASTITLESGSHANSAIVNGELYVERNSQSANFGIGWNYKLSNKYKWLENARYRLSFDLVDNPLNGDIMARWWDGTSFGTSTNLGKTTGTKTFEFEAIDSHSGYPPPYAQILINKAGATTYFTVANIKVTLLETIPCISDSNDVIDTQNPSHPAGPWLYDDLGYKVDFAPALISRTRSELDNKTPGDSLGTHDSFDFENGKLNNVIIDLDGKGTNLSTSKMGACSSVAGYYVEGNRAKYDFHDATATTYGRSLAVRDQLGKEATVTFDDYDLLPKTVTDPVGMQTEAWYDYRLFTPYKAKDPNDNFAEFAFNRLGLLYKSAAKAKYDVDDGSSNTADRIADDLDHPAATMEYDFFNFMDNGDPIWVKTTQRQYHYYGPTPEFGDKEDTIVSCAYSDGFGRVLQSRSQAEEVIYGDSVYGDSGLPIDQTQNANCVGEENTSTTNLNVVVNGFTVYNNKGLVVEQYEPYFDKGFDYKGRTEVDALLANAGRGAVKARMFFDARGQAVRTLNPDNTESRVVMGTPHDVENPSDMSGSFRLRSTAGGASAPGLSAAEAQDSYTPSPWISYAYDANDMGAHYELPLDDDGIPVTASAAKQSLGLILPDDATHDYTTHNATPKITEIDELGRTIRTTEYKATADEEDVVMQYEYDIRGNVLSIIDAYNRNVFQHKYSLANQTLWTHHLDSGNKTVVYDLMGRPVELRDAKGSHIVNGYDELSRPIRMWAADNSEQDLTLRSISIFGDDATYGPANPKTTNHLGMPYKGYDEAGLVEITDYHFSGAPLTKKQQVISDSTLLANFPTSAPYNITPYTVDWVGLGSLPSILDSTVYQTDNSGFDALGRPFKTTLPADVNSSRKELKPQYNKAGALHKVHFDGTEYVKEMAYDAKGQPLFTALGNGIMTRYVYSDTNFRLLRTQSEKYTYTLTGTEHKYAYDTGSKKHNTAHQYDLAGNILKILERSTNCGLSGTPDQLDRAFSYDPLNRLLSATGREGQNATGTEFWGNPAQTGTGGRPTPTSMQAYTRTYAYDKMGNITQLKQTQGTTFTRNFEYNDPNSNILHCIKQADEVTSLSDFTYDVNGNRLTSGTSRNYTWDYSDQLKAYLNHPSTSTDPNTYAQYLYSGGKRVKKLVRSKGGSTETIVYIDGVFEHRYDATYGQTTTHIGGVASNRVGHAFDGLTGDSYSLSNHLGSVSLRLDQYGSDIDHEEYYPFGDSSVRTWADGAKRYRYVGKEKDAESGLYYYGARYYAAWTCKFISTDPLASQTHYQSGYAYADNNPVMMNDPTGMISEGKGGPKPLDTKTENGKNYTYFEGQGWTEEAIVERDLHLIEMNVEVNWDEFESPSMDNGYGTSNSESFSTHKSGILVTPFIIDPAIEIAKQQAQKRSSQAATRTSKILLRGARTIGLIVSFVLIPKEAGRGSTRWDPSTRGWPDDFLKETPDPAPPILLPNPDTEDQPQEQPKEEPKPTDVIPRKNDNEYITLYRGVSEDINPRILYEFALAGIAYPKGLLPDSPFWGGHENPDDHTMSDNYSIWTSWTEDVSTAENFARGPLGTSQGVVLSKRVRKSRLGVDIIKSDLAISWGDPEGEWLIPGVTHANIYKYVGK